MGRLKGQLKVNIQVYEDVFTKRKFLSLDFGGLGAGLLCCSHYRETVRKQDYSRMYFRILD